VRTSTLGKLDFLHSLVAFQVSSLTSHLRSQGASLCYLNTYPGDYEQWGCGSTDWATNIETSYSGMPANTSLQIVTTGNEPRISITSSTTTSSTTTSTPQVTSLTTTSRSESSSHTTAGFSTTSAFSSSSLPATPVSSTSPSSKSSVPMAAVAAGAIGGIAAIAVIGGLCLFGKRKGWFHRGSGHQHIHHHHTSVGAFSAEPKFDKRGVLITESHEMASGSGVKKSSKPKSSPSSVSGAKKGLKTKVGSASESKVKKNSRQRAG